MVTMVMAQAQRHVVAGASPIPIRLETYDASDRVERAEPSPPMDSRSQMRNRGAGLRNPLPDENSTPARAQSGHSVDAPRQEGIQGGSGIESFAPTAARTTSNESLPGIVHGQWEEQVLLSSRDYGHDRLEYDRVEKHDEGLPQLSSFINSHDNNAIFRRFGRMSARTLVQLQIDLTELEKELDKLDHNDALDPVHDERLRGLENYNGWNEDQRKIIVRLQNKLCEYFKLLVLESQVRALGQATPRNHLGLLTWMMNEKPLMDGRDGFIFHPEDFVSVAKPSDKAIMLGDWIEAHVLDRWPTKLKWILQTERDRSRITNKFVDQWSTSRLGILVKLIAVVLAVCLLLIPVMLLFLSPMSRQAMAWTVFAFVLAFCGTLAVLVEARVQDVFVGTAAYAAVLVTFLGNLNHP